MGDLVTFEGTIHHPSDRGRFALVKLDNVIGPFSEAVINNRTIGWENVLNPATGLIMEKRIRAEGHIQQGLDAIVATKLQVIPFNRSP